MLYTKPSIELLDKTYFEKDKVSLWANEIERSLSDCLSAFDVRASFIKFDISSISIIFSYSLNPGCSLKEVSKLTADLSLAAGSEVKVFTKNDDSNVISISVLRPERSHFGLGSIIDNRQFEESDSPLTIAAGIDEFGNEVYFDLCSAPHLLVSGATGSGKTVFTDDVIVSILCKATPAQVKLLLIDPDKKDFNVYEDIPHLYCPVCSYKPDIVNAIISVKNEMDRRFFVFAENHIKDIDGYNKINMLTPLPRIVVVIDKYLELTYEVPEDFEGLINEIARKGRAAGVHLIINTQTSRSEVLSNDIKVNIPYRVAFSVLGWSESKMILNRTGANKLLGDGDMLFVQGHGRTPIHVQAASITINEIESIVKNILKNNPKVSFSNINDTFRPNFDDEYVKRISETISQMNRFELSSFSKKIDASYDEAYAAMDFLKDNELISETYNAKGRDIDKDKLEKFIFDINEKSSDSQENDLLDAAVSVVSEKCIASVDILQKALGIGFVEAAELIKLMEQKNIIEHFSNSKNRKVLISKSDWESRKSK